MGRHDLELVDVCQFLFDLSHFCQLAIQTPELGVFILSEASPWPFAQLNLEDFAPVVRRPSFCQYSDGNLHLGSRVGPAREDQGHGRKPSRSLVVCA